MFDREILVLFLLAFAQSIFFLGILASFSGPHKFKNKALSLLLFLASGSLTLAPCIAYRYSFSFTASPLYLGFAPLSLRIDGLASFFLLLLGVVGMSIALFTPAYLEHLKKDRQQSSYFWTCLFSFCSGISLSLLAANALSFLLFWELMSLSSVALVASEFEKQKARKAAFIYLAATRISSSLLCAGFIWIVLLSKNHWDFQSWNLQGPETALPSGLLLLGLAIKAGLWPFHIWLPHAHPEAPAPVSALMSGVMVKVSIYMILRIFLFQNSGCSLLACLLIGLGIVSSLWGVLFALMQDDLKTLLAYSTVENMGLIAAGTGLALLARQLGQMQLAELALAGVFLHCLNHALFKPLLFLGAGCIDANAHTRDLSLLGGLAKSMPITLLCFFTGSIAICALPPLNGFISKWLFYKSFFQAAFTLENPAARLLCLAIIGILSFVGALSIASFSKAVGIAFLGRARSRQAEKASEKSGGMLIAQIFMSLLCIAAALLSSTLLSFINPLIQSGLDQSSRSLTAFGMPFAPLFLLSYLLLILSYLIFLFPKNKEAKEFITWECGFGQLGSRAEETSASFAQPIGRIFSGLLQYKIDTEIEGKDRRHFPESIKLEASMPSFLETRVYGPLLSTFTRLSSLLMHLQTGSIHIHLLYVLITILLVSYLGITLGGN